MSLLNIVIFMMACVALTVLFVLLRDRRPARAEAGAPVTRQEESPMTPETPTSIYAAISPLVEAFNVAARPAELYGHPALVATVALFREAPYGDDHLLQYALGEHPGLRCAAFMAIVERGAAFTLGDRLVSEYATLTPWFGHFALTAIAACMPAADQVCGQLLLNVSIDAGGRSWTGNAAAVEDLRAFIAARLAGGEPAGFTPAQMAVIERHSSQFDLHRICERLGLDLTAPWRDALALAPNLPEPRAEERPADDDPERARLAELGRVWDAAPSLPGRRLLPVPAQEALVERIERSLEANPARPCLLVGETGAGKRAVFEALARRLLDRRWNIVEAGHTEIIANQKYVGEMEGRLQSYVQVLGRPRHLWLIPDLGALRSTGAHEHKRTGALHLLLPHFEAGTVRMVGMLTPSAWEALQQAVPAARAIFDVVKVEPLDAAASQDLARAWLAAGGEDAPALEDDRVLGEAWLLAQQFLADRAAPGCLLQLLDRARRRAAHAGAGRSLGRGDLVATLAELTGLPESFLDDRQSYDLKAVRAFFRERILGQDEAVECLVQRIAMLKAGLGDPSRPQGVFLFAGPTGTGKTEIAKVLAEFLFGSAARLVRVDMSEYNERGSAARLLRAAAPGQEAGGGPLAGPVRQRPFSVVLLDEFEKASRDVWDLFLQVADDGRLTDEHGETVDFRHTIIILTSNLGSRVERDDGLGFSRAAEEFRPQDVEKAVVRTFRPEFVNRLDRIVVFRPFTRETMRELLRLEIRKAEKRRGLRHRDWATIWDDSAVDFLLERGFTVDLGARPLRRAVERHLLEPLATIIAQGRSPAGDQFLYVHAGPDRLLVDFIDPDAPAGAATAAPGDEEVAAVAATPQSVLLAGHGGDEELAALAATHAGLLARLEGGDLRRRKSEGLAAMAGADFWDSEGRFAVLDRVENIDRVESGLESAGQLLERLLAPARGRRAARTVPADLLVKLAGTLHLLEAALGALERDEPWDAYLLVDAGGDGGPATPEADAWAQRVARMYERWADARRLKRVVLQENAGPSGQPWRQVTAISGFAACALLAGECGLHVWEDPDPRRDGGFRRHTALVRAVAQPARAAADRAAALREGQALLAAPTPDRLQLVRQYREQPAPLVRDRLRGWRSGRPERVLDGNFDLMRGDG